jgi:hypothetical protein
MLLASHNCIPVEKANFVTCLAPGDLDLPKKLVHSGFTQRERFNSSLFSCSLRTAHCGRVPSCCTVQFRVLQLHWAMTSKYRPLLLLFCALYTHNTTSNNDYGKGTKQMADGKLICFSNLTKFRSRLPFTVQFKRLLWCCCRAKNIVTKEVVYLLFTVTSLITITFCFISEFNKL